MRRCVYVKLQKPLLIFFTLLFFVSCGRNVFLIKGKLSNCDASTAYLIKNYGHSKTIIDSAQIKKQSITLKIPKTEPRGIYTIYYSNEHYFDFVFDQNNLSFEMDCSRSSRFPEFANSIENENFYQLKNSFYEIEANFKKASDSLKKHYGEQNKSFVDSLVVARFNLSNKKKYDVAKENFQKNPNLISAKILWAMQLPDFEKLAKKGEASYQLFYKNYFNHFDFMDSIYLHSKSFFKSSIGFLQNFVLEQSDSGYIDVSEKLLTQVAAYPLYYNYTLELLDFYLTNEDRPNVANYIKSKYSPVVVKEVQSSANTNAQSLVGMSAPDFYLTSVNDAEIHLFDIKADAVLLFFWAPDCFHCEDAIPIIKRLAEKFDPAKWEIIAISIDENKNIWKKHVEEYQLQDWINVSDHLGVKTPLADDYRLKMTPSFFLLNAQKTIVFQANEPEKIVQYIENQMQE